jgi:Protein of unknown function (Hypoth_ymh)
MPKTEPPDYFVYNFVSFDSDTFEFYLAAIQFYESLLEGDLKTVREDPDLQAILGQQALESYPIAKELKRVQRLRNWLQEQVTKSRDTWGIQVDISHDFVRFVKSVSLLYLQHLRRRRELLASRPLISKSLLEAVDQQLARFEEKTQIGVFRNATQYPLAVSQLPHLARDEAPTSAENVELKTSVAPRPVVLESIEIRDPTLRKRCLDLFAQFREDGQHDRLDTVVNEATRILEDRLRSLSGAPATCVGVDLAKHAFASPIPRLVVSDISAEQEAAHLLYRGVFGFVRNSVHHRLVGTLQPERVLQIVGLVDYLLSVAEAARRQQEQPAANVV